MSRGGDMLKSAMSKIADMTDEEVKMRFPLAEIFLVPFSFRGTINAVPYGLWVMFVRSAIIYLLNIVCILI